VAKTILVSMSKQMFNAYTKAEKKPNRKLINKN